MLSGKYVARPKVMGAATPWRHQSRPSLLVTCMPSGSEEPGEWDEYIEFYFLQCPVRLARSIFWNINSTRRAYLFPFSRN